MIVLSKNHASRTPEIDSKVDQKNKSERKANIHGNTVIVGASENTDSNSEHDHSSDSSGVSSSYSDDNENETPTLHSTPKKIITGRRIKDPKYDSSSEESELASDTQSDEENISNQSEITEESDDSDDTNHSDLVIHSDAT